MCFFEFFETYLLSDRIFSFTCLLVNLKIVLLTLCAYLSTFGTVSTMQDITVLYLSVLSGPAFLMDDAGGFVGTSFASRVTFNALIVLLIQVEPIKTF